MWSECGDDDRGLPVGYADRLVDEDGISAFSMVGAIKTAMRLNEAFSCI